MTLKQQIEIDMRTAMKAQDKKVNILKFILAEFQRRPNLKVEITDEEVISIIKKFIKSYEESAKITGTMTDTQKFEIDVLSSYLPKMATDEEIKAWITKNIELSENKQARMKSMGKIMKAPELVGRVDGNQVRNILMSL